MDNLVHEQDREKIAVHEEQWGRYNDAPPGWQEVTEKELVESRRLAYPAKYIEFRQIMPNGIQGPMLSAKLFFLSDNTGYALSEDWRNRRIHWYLFGCDHVASGKRAPRALHNCESYFHCRKCGYETFIDSSD